MNVEITTEYPPGLIAPLLPGTTWATTTFTTEKNTASLA